MNTVTFAVEETHATNVNNLTYKEIYAKAKHHSYDLQLADFDITISKEGIREARSEYYPKINLGANAEYNRNLRDYLTPISVGDSLINPYTRYQSLLGLNLSYNLFDFGIRRKNLNIAKEDVILKEVQREEELQELTLTIIDIYSKANIAYKQIKINEEILAKQKEILKMKLRLQESKEISATDVSDQITKVELTSKKINELKSNLLETLNLLSFYTDEIYDINKLQMHEIQKPNINVNEEIDYTKTIGYKLYSSALKKKELELRIAKCNYLPKATVYSKYYIYGSDKSNYFSSVGDIQPSSFAVGGSLSMPIFDGFKNSSKIRKLALETKKIQVEREKAVNQYKNRLATLKSNSEYLNKQMENYTIVMKEMTSNEKRYNRLFKNRLISAIEAKEFEIRLLEQKSEYEKTKITSTAVSKSIEAMIIEHPENIDITVIEDTQNLSNKKDKKVKKSKLGDKISNGK